MSATLQVINQDPFCNVRMENIRREGQLTDKYMVAMQRPESEEFVDIPGVAAVHSEDYRLIKNEEVHNLIQEVMDSTGYEFLPLDRNARGIADESQAQHRYWNGRSYQEKWYLPQVNFEMGGTTMMMGVGGYNSYDGSCSAGLSFFAMALRCANQFYSSNLLGQPYSFRHINRGDTMSEELSSSMALIKSRAAGFALIAPQMKMLEEKKINSFADFLNLRTRIKEQVGISPRDKDLLDELSGCGISNKLGIETAYDSANPSYWDVANVYTALSTHGTGGFTGDRQSRRVTDFLLKA